MAHTHHCAVCKVPTAICADETCQTNDAHANSQEHYCSIHHPDPEHHVEPPPQEPKFTVAVRKID